MISADFQRSNIRTILALLLLVVLLPVALIPLPPLLDYPNHLARLWLLGGGIDTAPVNRFYVEDWHGIATNIGIDLVAKAFAHVVPPFLLGRLLLALAVVLPPVGAIALNASQFGNFRAWQLVFPFFWCTETLLAGFLNFQIGLGLALLAAALDPRFSVPWARHASRLAVAFVLIVVHPFALLFYCMLLAGIGIGAAWPGRAELRPAAWRVGAAGAVCLVPIAAFFVLTHALPGDDSGRWFAIFNPPLISLFTLLSPVTSYNFWIDLAIAYPLLVLVGYALVNRRIAAHRGLLAVAAFLAVASLFMPAATSESGWLDRRLPIMAVLAALAATDLSLGPSRRDALRLAAAAFALVAVRTAWIGWNWAASFEMVHSLRQAFADIPAGKAVLPLQHRTKRTTRSWPLRGRTLGVAEGTFWHYPALIVPYRHAFVPTLFAQRGKQPISVRPPWDQISDPGGGVLPSVHCLEHPARCDPYLRHWRTRFDFVLVLNADQPDRYGPFVPPPELQLVKDAGFARLYLIRRPRS